MLAALLAVSTMPTPPLPEVELKPGLVIRQSVRVKPGTYSIPNADATGKAGAIVIEGADITVDFQGATIRGTPETARPDQRAGTGITVRGAKVTLRNANVHGYKVGLAAWGVPGFTLVDSDFSYNWKQRLLSDREKEDLADWMSFHRNEKDEWLRYGAAVYLRDCDDAKVRGVRAWGGQCGLMMTDCDRGFVVNNDMSFLSAVGLGLYRSNENRVLHNKFDWCVRGYSHGVYSRGQDSTGILIYEQSNWNVFAYNSATHGGDGFFLWAGQTTMDSGEGGCNFNLLYGNDFSHAPANGIEATFSRNTFANNLLLECGNGVWGGYSFDTLIVGNVFGLNGSGVAIEHGQFNRIEHNVFDHEGIAVRLWANDRPQDPNWGYPKFRDTRNVGTLVQGNSFVSSAVVALDLGLGERLDVRDNDFALNRRALDLKPALRSATLLGNTLLGPAEDWPRPGVTAEGTRHVSMDPRPARVTIRTSMISDASADDQVRSQLDRLVGLWQPWPDQGRPMAPAGLPPVRAAAVEARLRELAPARVPGGMDPFLAPDHPRGREFIIVDEWGPYDFRRPILHETSRRKVEGGEEVTFRILGPKGRWRLVEGRGLTPSARNGAVPGEVKATIRGTGARDVRLALSYTGEATVDHRGVATPQGRPVPFGWSESRFPIDWTVKWFRWDTASDPRTQPEAFAEILKGTAVREVKTEALDVVLPRGGVPDTYFATLAEGSFSAPPGDYLIELTTDDGARVWLDGEPLVEDAWKYQGPTTYARKLRLSGAHRLRVEHFQIDGYSTLRLKVRRASP